MEVVQNFCFNVYYENEGVVKSVLLRKFVNSENYVFQDVLMSGKIYCFKIYILWLDKLGTISLKSCVCSVV